MADASAFRYSGHTLARSEITTAFRSALTVVPLKLHWIWGVLSQVAAVPLDLMV